MPILFTLKRDDKEILTGTEIECIDYIHSHHCYSLDHAIKYEGYKLVPVNIDTTAEGEKAGKESNRNATRVNN